MDENETGGSFSMLVMSWKGPNDESYTLRVKHRIKSNIK